MPHNSHSSHSRHGGSSSDDLGSTDEVKIFKDEGDREEEKISSENLLEEKSSLIDLTESEEKSGKLPTRPDLSPVFSKLESHAPSFNMGYLVSPYSYSNGGAGGLPVTMANKIGLSPFFCHNGDPLTTPPPAHCGIPPYQLDPKAMGLTRPAIYSFPSSQYAYPMLGPDMTPSWHTPSVYSAASSFRSPYPSSLPINTTLSSDFPFRFPPNLLPSVHTSPHHVLNSHPAIVTSGPKQDCNQEPASNHRYSRNLDSKISTANQQGNECKDNSNEKKKPHIKKPLNAFMLYMKEMRAKVVAECTLKESAAINQILGRRWHALGREEQAKYYELARRERQLHMQMYPDWSSRTNTSRGKKRKRKQDTNDAGGGGNNMKKCRARFGLDQQNQWCKPCRRKKKCIRYMEGLSSNAGSSGTKDDSFQDLDDLEEDNASDDNLGSPGSIDDNNKTPDDDTESLNNSLSSPGCQSGLSSLQSPSTSMASPLNLLASPATPVTVGVPFGLSDNQQEQNVPSQQQQLQQASSEQQMRMQHHHHQQQQMHLSQHQQLMQHHHPHPTHTNNSIYEQHAKGARPFLCNSGSGVGVGRSTLMSPALSNNGASGICIGSNNSLTNTSTTPSAVAAAAAFTERTMRSLLNPSPSGLLLNNNCFPQSTLEPSGAIVSIEQILANSNSLSTSTATTTPTSAVAKYPTTTNTNSTLSNRATDESNSFITYSSNSNASFTNSNTNNNGVCEPNAMQAVTSTQPILSAVVKTKSSVSSSASSEPSSPACDTYEKSVPPAQRNPIGANPHDINNPLSINQLTKCSESTSSNNNISCTVTKNSDNNADPSSLDNVPTAFNSLTNGIAAKQYKHSPQQLQKQLALRIPTIAATPQHQSLLPPVPQHYQQQFNLHAGTGPPTPSTHHHAHHHAHSPLFNQHFQQFSHHLASVAAAAAAASIHMPNILSAAAAVNPNNNSIQRNSRSGATTHEAVDAVATTAATTIAASETTLNNETGTESSANMPAAKCHATQSTTAVTTPTAKTLPVLATDSAAIANVSTSKTGSENGAISVT
ncbi:protein pangolin, isoforms A/H/I/S isoform X8 [Zeugodacus cucurbitae]|uniref:protein pangolin, isoforms A/H/I/S isoform X8 n=1 Tax=Zeugodacus cucurbitae TaxID=28588 RepID=UPI0005969CEF|nr:protein pangolin, isoforms A/H/I/S isoform X8 [Zeugodacus cucurbitae]